MAGSLKKYSLFSIYLLGFLFALQTALPNYINSSFLSTLMSEKLLGVIYISEAVLAIAGFFLMSKILRRFGNFKVAIVMLLLETAALFGLALNNNVLSASFFMTVSITLLTFLSFSLDIFLEGNSLDANTGKIRGIYMTCVNLAWAISPFLTGLILADTGYSKIYLAAFLLSAPIFIVLRTALGGFKDSAYPTANPFQTLSQIWKNKDLLNIFLAGFLLQIFYCWMTVYTPIYLHLNLGLGWGQIGIIFSVMLLPFIFVQFPAGELADSRFGEKEMLSLGFIIMALATMVMYFVAGQSLLVWALILFSTRVGAAVVEIMCDVYFFKKVDSQNADIISFYRMARPWAYIFGPLLAIILLSLPNFEMKNLFLVLGFLMFFGLKFSFSIKDTK